MFIIDQSRTCPAYRNAAMVAGGSTHLVATGFNPLTKRSTPVSRVPNLPRLQQSDTGGGGHDAYLKSIPIGGACLAWSHCLDYALKAINIQPLQGLSFSLSTLNIPNSR